MGDDADGGGGMCAVKGNTESADGETQARETPGRW